MTYSIVARDAATGQIGVAVQSHWFSVGSVVSWAEPGVGAVATQAFAEPAYGPKALALLRAGAAPADVLAQLLAADEHPEVRQVAMVDAAGRVAVHTGGKAVAEAGHAQGDGFSVQANLMARPTVPAAMKAAYEHSTGDLAARLFAALEAAEGEGGDVRGKQSAALLIVSGDQNLPAWGGRIFDLRVEDSDAPLPELKRLIGLARAYRLMTEGDDAVAVRDFATARQCYRSAMALAPDNHEMMFWTAATLIGAGDADEAMALFSRAFAIHPPWRTLIKQLPAIGLLPDDAALVARIEAAGR